MEIKPGIWCVNMTHSEPRKPILITEENIDNIKEYLHKFGPYLQAWVPKVAEWCWFWDTEDYTPCIGQFKNINCNGMFESNAFNGSACEFCEPFIGELPSFLKKQI